MLGPLVVGCAAFCVDAPPDESIPNLWQALRKMVGKSRCRFGRKLHVNDSKQVYSPSVGLKELEKALLTFATAKFGAIANLEQLCGHVAAHVMTDLPHHPFYHPAREERFPLENDGMAILTCANGLKAEMTRSKVQCVHLAARVLLEKPLNRMFEATRNKSNTLFSIAAIHLDHLLREFGEQGLVIFCDRQGGREHYGPGLRQMFEEWSLDATDERDGRSEYRLSRGGHTARIIFCEKAEAQCMPVALASMLCKYLRETFMERYNAYWRTHLPDLQPTAGYHPDGQRFYKAIQSKMAELGIGEELVVRSR
jgi:hypothetical protein